MQKEYSPPCFQNYGNTV